jgi:hypothetical protein
VNEVAIRLTPTEFGRLAQVILALSFQGIGFSINHFQQVGRPDFLAERRTQMYAVEVKAPGGNEVILKKEDLMGVENLGHQPILAVLTFPELDAQWLVLPSGGISPHAYQKTSLKKYNMSELSQEVNESFLNVLINHRNEISRGASDLRKLMRSTS